MKSTRWACIPKGESMEEKEMHDDPEDIVAADGDATRPITNTSPWLSAYESIRYDDLEYGREAVITENMHGARDRPRSLWRVPRPSTAHRRSWRD